MTRRGNVVVDRAGVILDVDALFCRTLRATPALMLGRNMLRFTAPADHAQCRLLMQRLLVDKMPITTTKRLIRTDTSHIWVQTHLTLASDDRRVSVVVEDTAAPVVSVRPEALLRTAKVTLEARRARSEIFCASLFSDSAWDILLAAYISESEGALLTVSDLQAMLGVSLVNLSRWLRALGAQGLIEYESSDGTLPAEAAFRLSCDSHQRFERYLSDRYAAAISATTSLEQFR